MAHTSPLFNAFRHCATLCGHYVLDALFPKRCLGCRIFDTWLCATCHTTLPLLTEQKCPLCTTAITPQGEVCHACSTPLPALAGVFVASSYDNDLLKRVIHHFKYRFIDELDAPLAFLLAQALTNTHLPSPDVIIPVPLHPRRLRWRGFNQATRIAQALDLTIPLDTMSLCRARHTTSQVTMRSKKRRQNNLAGAFAVQHPENVAGKNILLIDDVITTGTTLTECAAVLKDAGASSITALVLARE